MSFAGNSDWRVATSLEHASFVKAMESEKLIPYYATVTMPRLIAVDDNESKAVNTHNTAPTGDIETWENLLTKNSTIYATKCVRN